MIVQIYDLQGGKHTFAGCDELIIVEPGAAGAASISLVDSGASLAPHGGRVLRIFREHCLAIVTSPGQLGPARE